MRWFWGYKYGTARCPECGIEEPINSRGRMGRHRRFVEQAPPAMSYRVHCAGSGKRPADAGKESRNECLPKV